MSRWFASRSSHAQHAARAWLTAQRVAHDDARVLRYAAGFVLALALACVHARAPEQAGAMPEIPAPRDVAIALPELVETVAPAPSPIIPMPVGQPAPWHDDPELRAKILAVDALVDAAAARRNLEPELLLGLIWVESKFDPAARGGDAQGLMQLMPNTASALAKELERPRDSFEPEFAIEAGALLVRKLLDRFDGDVDLALAAYNRGSGVVAGWVREGQPMPARTRSYVDRVLRARRWFLDWPVGP